MIRKVGVEVGSQVIKCRQWGHEAAGIFGGKPVNPINAIPGGMSKPINKEEQARLNEIVTFMVEFARFTLKLFHDIVLSNSQYVDLILNGPFRHETYSMGLVDAKNLVNFYDGQVRVVDPEGKELCKYAPSDYTKVVAERVEPWTYLKFPYLKQVGWKGLVDGKDSGVYRATPAGAAERGGGDEHARGAGRLRGVLRDPHRRPERPETGPQHPGDPLGPPRGAPERG